MKPNNFPVRPSLNGTEELYTQTNNLAQKFTLEKAKAFITEPTDITYSELYNKVVDGGLIAGSWYRLTDYKSINFLNGYEIAENNPTPVDPNFNPQEIYTGETEVLLLQAITEYEISPIGYSENFQGEIVQYSPYTNKIGLELNVNNGNTLPDSNTVSGFDLQWDGTNVYFEMPAGYPALFGYVFYVYAEFDGGSYRLSQAYFPLTPNNPKVGYIEFPLATNGISNIRVENNGTKIVLLDFTQQDYLDYDINTLFVQSFYALGDAYGQMTRRIDTLKNIDVPFDFRGRRYRRFECEIFGNITTISYTFTGSTASDNTYIITNGQYTTNSVQGQNAVFKIIVNGGAVTSVSVNNAGRLYADGETFTIDGTLIGGTSGVDDVVITITQVYSNIDYWGQGDVFKGATTTGNYFDFPSINYPNEGVANIKWEDSIAYLSDNNVFLSEVADIELKGYTINNTIGNCYICKFDFGFNDNTIGNISNSSVGIYFEGNTINQCSDNQIGANFYENIIKSFNNNIIGDYFNFNTIGNNFDYNNIGYGFSNNIIENNFSFNAIQYNFNNNRILTDFRNNNIANSFYNNNILDYFENNSIGNYFENNVIGNNFKGNSIGINFKGNSINDDFGYLSSNGITFGNKIGNDFIQNTIGKNFYSNVINNTFTGNTIGSAFNANEIVNEFSDNIIGNKFSSNTITKRFLSCTVLNEFKLNTIEAGLTASLDFSLATHVYANYNCRLFTSNDSNIYLEYFNITTATYVSPTA